MSHGHEFYVGPAAPLYSGPGAPPRQYITAAADGCVMQGCQLRKAGQLLEQARQLIINVRRESMSAALWCDASGHAFSERDPGRQRIAVSVLNEETGLEETEARDFCGECAERAGLLKRKTRPDSARVLTSEPAPAPPGPRVDPAKVRGLEDELGMPHAPLG